MRAAKTTPESDKQIHHLATALKAPGSPGLRSVGATHARDAGSTHEDYLAIVLEREVSAHSASGADLRIRAAGFQARKTLEDFEAQPSIRNQLVALASGAFLTEARNIVLLGRSPDRDRGDRHDRLTRHGSPGGEVHADAFAA